MDLTNAKDIANGISEQGYIYIISVLSVVIVALFILLIRELIRARKSESETAKELATVLTQFNNNVDNLIESNNKIIESVTENTKAVRELEKKL
jgi:biopolymer transport protein ExbB/TolQ